MTGFLGRYDYQMDEKGRVSLPAAFRREADGERFVLLQWQKPFLTLFPEDAWARVQEKLLEQRRTVPGAERYFRRITSTATEVVPDRQGRILIPGRLREMAGLEDEVALIGALDRIELWDPGAYSAHVPDTEDDVPQQIASEVFG